MPTRGSLLLRIAVRWTRLAALLFTLLALVPSLVVNPACLTERISTEAPCDGEDEGATPCSCPVTCGTCVAVRGVPATSSTVVDAALVHRPARQAASLEIPPRPAAPDPGEIGHVPRA